MGDWVQVKGWNGEPQWLQTAKVDFEYHGKSFMSIVAVAHEDDLCSRVLFSVPMDGDMASRLLLDAASTSHSSEGEAGHPGDTPGIQTSSQDDTCSGSTPRMGQVRPHRALLLTRRAVWSEWSLDLRLSLEMKPRE